MTRAKSRESIETEQEEAAAEAEYKHSRRVEARTRTRRRARARAACRVKGLLHFREDFNDFACSCQGQLTTGTHFIYSMCTEHK